MSGHAIIKPTEMVNQEEFNFFAYQLRNAVNDGANIIIVDCESVRYMNSSAIGLLIETYMTLSERGGMLRLVSPDRVIRRSFEMVGLLSLIEVYDSIEQAISA